jgi:hypothetical protein
VPHLFLATTALHLFLATTFRRCFLLRRPPPARSVVVVLVVVVFLQVAVLVVAQLIAVVLVVVVFLQVAVVVVAQLIAVVLVVVVFLPVAVVVVVVQLIAMASLPRETLGEPDPSPRDAGLNLRQQHHPHHLAQLFAMLVSNSLPKSAVGALPRQCRRKSCAPFPDQEGFAARCHISTKCSPFVAWHC